MNAAGIIATIGLVLLYSTALVKIYLDVKVKLTKLDLKILNLETEFNEHKIISEAVNVRLEDKSTTERTAIFNKMDTMLEKIVELRINQGVDSKAAHIAASAAATAAAAAVVAAIEQGKFKTK